MSAPFSAPWRPISEAKKDGRLLVLLVDYSEQANRAAIEAEPGYVWSPNPLEDETLGRTIGSNNEDLVGEGEGGWSFAGCCWSHDHHVNGRGTPVAFIELDDAAPLPGGGCVMEEHVHALMETSGLPEHVVRASLEASS